MAIVTGNALDFGYQSMSGRKLRIFFVPSAPAVGLTTSMFASAPIEATWVTASEWTVELAPTNSLRPGKGTVPIFYKIVLEWLDAAGNFTGKDNWEVEFRVPSAGGRFEDLVGAVLTGDLVYVGPADSSGMNPGIPIPAIKGAGWVNSSGVTGGRVPYYEWED